MPFSAALLVYSAAACSFFQALKSFCSQRSVMQGAQDSYPALPDGAASTDDYPVQTPTAIFSMPSSFIPLIATLAIQMLTALAMLAMPVLAPAAAPDIGVPPTYVGVFVGLAYLGAISSSLLSGGFVRRFGPIRISQISLVTCAAGLLVLLTASPWLMVLSALMIGVGYGPITPASSHVLIRTTPRHLLSLIFSVKQTGVPLGGMLAGLLLPPLILAFGWRGGVLVIVLACIVVAVLAESTRRELDTDLEPGVSLALSMQSIVAPLKLVWSVPTLRLLGASSFFFSAVQVTVATFLLPYLTTQVEFSLITAGVIYSVAQGAGVIGRIVWGYLADRVVTPPVMLACIALMSTSASLLAASIGPGVGLPLPIVLALLYGSAAIGWNGVYLAAVARQAPAGQASMATGGSLAITFLGSMLGAPIFGLIAELSGSYGMTYVVTTLPVAFCGIALFRARHTFEKSR
jgi:MFS family permease